MRDNCGIIALDALLKSLNMNMSRISLDTLSKICRDNGRLMFPIKVPKNKIFVLPTPYIMQMNNHYEVIEDETALSGIEFEDHIYILYPQLNTDIIPLVIDEDEAKEIKGACGDNGGVKNIPIIGPLLSKPARALPLIASAGGTMLGMNPFMTNILGTGIGALQGQTTGLWGEQGTSGATMKGAGVGFAESMLGRGVGGAFSPGNVGVNAAYPNQAWKGFQSGLEESIPFKSALFGNTNPITGGWNVNPGGNLDARIDPATQKMYFVPQGTSGNLYTPRTGAEAALRGSTAVGDVGGTQKGGGNMLPYALMGAGALLPQPEYEGVSKEEMLATLNQPATEAGRVASSKLIEGMQNPERIGAGATDELFSAMDAQWQDNYNYTMSEYASQLQKAGVNPYGSDYQKAMADKGNQLTLAHDVEKNQIRYDVWNKQVSAQIQYIASAYGVDAEILQDLVNMDVTQASIKYGVDVEKINQLREAIYNMALMSFYGNENARSNQQLIQQLGQIT